MLWFDVEKERETTELLITTIFLSLWFDVEKERETTLYVPTKHCLWLWFDVEKERETTNAMCQAWPERCDLM